MTVYNLHEMQYNDPLDEDGYPTDATLELIAKWNYEDPVGWFEFIESIWYLREWGWRKDGNTYNVSTAGWSGNESVISAMMKNWVLWSTTWVQSRRGGHYIFEVVE